jgi:type II secretory pathway pseudopilin PulG
MKTTTCAVGRQQGHTLLEMIGVACLIGLLASALFPKTLNTIDDARLAADVMSIKGMQGATETYFQQYGKLAGLNGVPITSWSYNAYEDWDESVLLAGNFAESAMRANIATNAYVRLVKVSNTSTTANILSAVGQVGRLPSFNSNNGFYNLMRQLRQPATRHRGGADVRRRAGPFPGLQFPVDAVRRPDARAAGTGPDSGQRESLARGPLAGRGATRPRLGGLDARVAGLEPAAGRWSGADPRVLPRAVQLARTPPGHRWR